MSVFIIIVNSRFLQCPQKWSCRNQLIHRRLSETKSIGKGSRSRESGRDAGRQSDSYGGWCLVLRWQGI